MSNKTKRSSKSSVRTTASIFEPLEKREMFSAGALDTSFSLDGKNTVDFGAVTTGVHGVAVQGDGKTIEVGGSSDGRFAIARLNFDGSLDTTYGPSHTGRVLTSFGSQYIVSANAVALDRSGRAVVVGRLDPKAGGYSRIVMARYNSDGSLDTTFGNSGLRIVAAGAVSIEGDDVALTDDGKILVGGVGAESLIGRSTNYDLVVARFTSSGFLDESFGDGGKRYVDFDDDVNTGSTMAVDHNGTPSTNPFYGTIVIAGTRPISNGGLDMAITRLTPGGDQDSRFAFGDGHEYFPFPHELINDPRGVTIQPGGKIVIAATVGATSGAPGNIGVMRLTSGGQIDTTFGNFSQNGFTIVDLGGNERAGDILQNTDGALIVGGTSDGKFAVTKLTTDGKVDGLFGVTRAGATITDFGDNQAGIARLAYGPGDRFVAVGGSNFHVARYLDTGGGEVFATTLNPDITEGGASGGFIVYTEERLPVATRVYFSISGTATAPSFFTVRNHTNDYTVGGMTIPTLGILGQPLSLTPFVDISANQTFAAVTLTALDDKVLEPDESATFSILPTAGYEVGNPSSASFTIHDNDGAFVKPTADAYVRDGSSATTNFGSATDLEVKKGATGLNRDAYLQFDISQLDVARLGTVQLQLFGSLSNANQKNVATSVFGLGDSIWSENQISFNNQPTLLTHTINPVPPSPIASATIIDATARLYTFDITAYVKQLLLAGKKTMTLELENTSNSDPFVKFNSKEAGSNGPQLVATYV